MIKYNSVITSESDFLKDVKLKNPLTMVGYGDSWMAGAAATGFIGTDRNLIPSFINQFRDYLLTINPNITFINTGGSGYSSADGLTNFQIKVLDFTPDYLILNFGINDWDGKNEVNRVLVPDFITNMQNMIDQAILNDIKVILYTSGVVSLATKTYNYVDERAGTAVKYSPIPEDGLTYKFKDYLTAVRNLATQNNLMLIDSFDRMDKACDAGMDIGNWFYDAIHLLQPGHNFIGQSFINSLKIETVNNFHSLRRI